MKIEEKKVVALTYTLTVDGQVADQATKERPLDFIFGMGYLLPKFEEYLLGLEAGDSYGFTLSPEEGYGVIEPERIVDIPKSAFEVNGELREDLLFVGNMIPMMAGNGGVVHGRVAEISDSSVKMDFNHPMAGKTLNFEGEIVEVREATGKELEEGLHGELKSHCCSGGCHGDCSGDCNCEGDCR
ncbi:MAG: peptidylprolyl isomerase [Bacteroidales bacterium]|nr:peptidylprolyl isomerase [Bacteroidales bacterium]